MARTVRLLCTLFRPIGARSVAFIEACRIRAEPKTSARPKGGAVAPLRIFFNATVIIVINGDRPISSFALFETENSKIFPKI